MNDLQLEARNALDVLAVLTETRPGNVRLNALDTLTRALKAARADARALWAVRVLDAWAGEHGEYARSWENCRKRGSDWVLLTDGGPYMIPGTTPDAARLAAAEAVLPILPAEKRACLGEKP